MSLWDLNLVLDVLVKELFEPLNQASLMVLTLKMVFLVAICFVLRIFEPQALSCQELFLSLFSDKVVLRPVLSFLPKMVLAFI